MYFKLYHRSGTDRRCRIGAEKTSREHSPGGSIFLREMTLWSPRHIRNPTSSVSAYLLEEQ